MLPLILTALCLPQSVRVITPEERAALEEKEDQRSAGELLTRLAGELVPAFFQRYPWLAYERRYPQPDPLAFARYGSEGFLEWNETLRRLDVQLDSISPDELDRGGWIAFQASAAWLRTQDALARTRSLERWDAASYVTRVEEMLFALTQSTYVEPIVRVQRTIRLLEALPDYWANAQRSLVSPARPWTSEAIERLVDLGLTLESDVPASFSDVRLPRQAGVRFDRAIGKALESTDRFRRFLLDSRARRGDEAGVLGASAWQGLVQTMTGTDLTSARLKTRLLRDVAGLDRKLGKNGAPQPGKRELVPLRIERSIRTASELAAQLADEAGLFSAGVALGEKSPLEVDVSLGRSRPRPLARLWPQGKAGFELHVEIGTTTWAPSVQGTRAAQLNPRALAALGIRYGWAGESLLRQSAGLTASPVARYLWNRSVVEGWGLYALDWIGRVDWAENPFLEDPRLADEIVRVWRLEAIRLLAAIELHVEGLSVPSAAEAFERRSGFDYETALLEVQTAHHDPLHGIGYLGLVELRALEEELAREITAREALRETLATVLSNPHLRPFDLRHRYGVARPR